MNKSILLYYIVAFVCVIQSINSQEEPYDLSDNVNQPSWITHCENNGIVIKGSLRVKIRRVEDISLVVNNNAEKSDGLSVMTSGFFIGEINIESVISDGGYVLPVQQHGDKMLLSVLIPVMRIKVHDGKAEHIIGDFINAYLDDNNFKVFHPMATEKDGEYEVPSGFYLLKEGVLTGSTSLAMAYYLDIDREADVIKIRKSLEKQSEQKK